MIQLSYIFLLPPYLVVLSDEKSMLKFIVAVGFRMIIASHHFIIDEFQFLLGSLAHDDFFVVLLGNDC